MRSILILAVVAALSMSAASASAQVMPERLVGGKLGGNWSQLSQPNDPEGEPTVLFGTAFTGIGFQAGAAFYQTLSTTSLGPLFLEVDALLTHRRGRGFAESRTSDARRELVIHSTGLHIPALLSVGIEGSNTLHFGVGPELQAGFGAGSFVRQTGIEEPAGQLPVAPAFHVGFVGQLGMIFHTASAHIPVDLRLTWDPFVGKSTTDRFDAYVDMNNTGEYRVAFNWQAMFNIGYLIDI